MRLDIKAEHPKELKEIIIKKVENNEFDNWEVKKAGEELYITCLEKHADHVVLFLDSISDHSILRITPNYFSGHPKPTDAERATVLTMFSAVLLTNFKYHFTKLEMFS